MATTRLPRAERREQVLTAAAAAFVHAGFEGTSMDDVARTAGVTRLILYRIFDSKYDLYVAVLDDVMTDLQHSFDASATRGANAAVAARLVGVARRHPDAFRLLWRHAATEPDFTVLAARFRAVVYDYAETLLAPEMHDEAMRHWAARAIVSYLYEGICLWLDDGDPGRDADVAAALTDGSRALVAAWSRASANR